MREKIIIAVLIDALGWEVLKRFSLPKEILPRSGPMETVLGYSSAAIPSLLTGLEPSLHGSWCMYSYNPRNSPFRVARFLPWVPRRAETRIRRMLRRFVDKRKLIEGYYDLYDIPVRYLRYFDVPQRQDPYVPGGTNRTIFDELEGNGVPYKVWEYRTSESDNFSAMMQSLQEGYRFLFLYTPELDSLMHSVGIYHESVGKKIEAYGEIFTKVMEQARTLNRDVIIYVFSDHGMIDVVGEIDIWGEMKKGGLRLGRDYMAFYDATIARFWAQGEADSEIHSVLARMDCGQILDEDMLKSLGCYFDDKSYGEVIFLANPGVMFVPSFMGREALRGMHGYHPQDKYSKACFLTNDLECELPRSILDLKAFLVKAALGKK
jgi:hypothetical protein